MFMDMQNSDLRWSASPSPQWVAAHRCRFLIAVLCIAGEPESWSQMIVWSEWWRCTWRNVRISFLSIAACAGGDPIFRKRDSKLGCGLRDEFIADSSIFRLEVDPDQLKAGVLSHETDAYASALVP